ncbi:MAG TPA: hypothetical protein VG323_08440 [Thermoanaerobaculia bacterium]|nr:hypothetical protein [Thermoanaerobaculia bacterium]
MLSRTARILLVAVLLLPGLAFAADSVTVGSVTANGNTVDVPVYVRDTSGTILGVDQPAGNKIQSFSFKVSYSPASAVGNVTFSRAGITQFLSPTFESSPSTAGTISWIATFPESTQPVPFTSNKAAPGAQVAHMVFTLSSTAQAGSTISLTLDSSVTQLSNQGGTTKESPGQGTLSLGNGTITVPAATITMTPFALNLTPGGNGFMTVKSSSPLGSDTTVTLSSSTTSVATVPASTTITAGNNSSTFSVHAVAVGHSQITATMGSSSVSASVNVAVPTPTCNAPDMPVLSAPSTASNATPYDVTWALVPNGNEFSVDEATQADFSDATSKTTTDTHATFSHSVTTDTRYYYRVTAKNTANGCSVSSLPSAAVSVLVKAPPPPPPTVVLTRYLAVVGSTAGNLGSFFRTSVQLYNSKSTTVSGKLVFHTANVSGGSGDPSMTFSLGAGKTITYPDLLPAMGISSGIGTLDIVSDPDSPLPVALVRVFNDAGALGTSGLTEDTFRAEDALGAGDTGVLIGPADATKFRLNIGVRTLSNGATITFTVRDKDGVVVKTISDKAFDPTWFRQFGSAELLGGYTLQGGETITVAVTAGNAIVYGATTDNVTQDPSVEFARKVD